MNVDEDDAGILRQEKIRLIGLILDLYFPTTPIEKGVKYWYGDMFDYLYEKESLELGMILKVYTHTRKQRS